MAWHEICNPHESCLIEVVYLSEKNAPSTMALWWWLMGLALPVYVWVLPAVLWVVGICTAGYFFGNLPWVKQHLDKIIWALILVPGLIAIFGAWRAGKADKTASSTAVR